MKNKILEKLQNSDGYVSGQELCELLGVSRTAVWKNIQALKNEGYVIEGVNNKGYRLVSEPDVMSEEKISKYLETRTFARKLYYYDETDSTNTRAKIVGETDCVHGALFVANEQTAGKGRRGHSWNSDKGTTISMSYLLKPDIDISCVSRITLVSAVALARAFSKVDGVKPQIKWPNDIVLNRKKVCGILTEMNMEIDSIAYVVVGVGINVNRMEFREDIAETATSLKKESGHSIERAELLSEILSAFFRDYKLFLEKQDLSPFLESYNQKLVNVGREVKIIKKGEEIIRTAIGINDRGELIVQDAEGNTEHIFSGEVSVRGIYGYV